MISSIVRTGFTALKRDRGALIMSFILPVAFFSIFAIIFGSTNNKTPRISLIVVDEDQSASSQRLVAGLQHEPGLVAALHPKPAKDGPLPPVYTASAAEEAVKRGDAAAALIIPKGFGQNPISFSGEADQPAFQLLHDSSDPVAGQVVAGLLQKVVMTSMGDVMAQAGMQEFAKYSGGLTPQQQNRIDASLAQLRQRSQQPENTVAPQNADSNMGSLVRLEMRDVVGAKKSNPMISFEAAGIGVMFLLFTASAAGGTLLDEKESGALDRILSSRVSMTELLAGKMAYCALLAFGELTVMFLWGALVFHLDLFGHLPGFIVMGVCTAFAVSSFGMLLATLAGTRAQQASVSTLLILTMSAIGGSMFPRFLMPEMMKKIGLITFNAWAIDGFTKVFWRDEPLANLLPQVSVLVGAGIVLFLAARRFARRWEFD